MPHQLLSILTSLVIPNNHISNSLGSNINTLFSYIDRHCKSLYDEWSTPIIFPQYRDSNKNHNDITRFVPVHYKGVDASDVLQQSYFSLDDYPIINGYNGERFRALSRDVQCSSLSSEFHIFKDNFHPIWRLNLSKVKRFCCSHSRRYVSQQNNSTVTRTAHQLQSDNEAADASNLSPF